MYFCSFTPRVFAPQVFCRDWKLSQDVVTLKSQQRNVRPKQLWRSLSFQCQSLRNKRVATGVTVLNPVWMSPESPLLTVALSANIISNPEMCAGGKRYAGALKKSSVRSWDQSRSAEFQSTAEVKAQYTNTNTRRLGILYIIKSFTVAALINTSAHVY